MEKTKVATWRLIEAWNEAEELFTSLGTLTDAELAENRVALARRAYAILQRLNKYVDEDLIEKYIEK